MFSNDDIKSIKLSMNKFCVHRWQDYNWDYIQIKPHIIFFCSSWINYYFKSDKHNLTKDEYDLLNDIFLEQVKKAYESEKTHSYQAMKYLESRLPFYEHDTNMLKFYGYRQYLINKFHEPVNRTPQLSGTLQVKGIVNTCRKNENILSKHIVWFTNYSELIRDECARVYFDDDKLVRKLKKLKSNPAIFFIEVYNTPWFHYKLISIK